MKHSLKLTAAALLLGFVTSPALNAEPAKQSYPLGASQVSTSKKTSGKHHKKHHKKHHHKHVKKNA